MGNAPPLRIHLDTDLGSDTDDLCALAMLIGWPGVDLVGVTTSTDPGGRRAGMTEYALGLAGRTDVPVVAGSEGSLSGLALSPLILPDYWPESIPPLPAPPGAAVDLLLASAEAGATIVSIGPYTNVAALEAARPGLLATTGLVLMGGHVTTPPEGFPPWGVHDDFNVNQDRYAAATVLERCDPLVVPLATSIQVFLRGAHLEELRAAGPLASLIADQGEAHARDNGRTELPKAYPGLPPDLLNFHYDPLACAVAAGWDGVTIERMPVGLDLHDERLWMSERPGASELRMVTAVEGERFERTWLDAVVRASSGAPD